MDSLIHKLREKDKARPDLIEALKELDYMIGLEDVKDKITEMVCEHVMNPLQTDIGSHCMVTGPPGVGKSSFIQILAKILCCLGVVKSQYRLLDTVEPNEVEKSILSKTSGAAFIRDQVTYILEDLSHEGLSQNITPEDPNIATRLKWIQTVSGEIFDIGKPYLVRHGIIRSELPSVLVPNIVKCSRSEVIGKYQGHSASNMRALYEKARGGILVIDEAYSLINDKDGEGDNYSQEALDTLNQLMSEQTETVVILGGYEDQIKSRLFSSQHGLQSRIQYVFNIVPPSNREMALMLQRRLGNSLSSEITLQDLEQLISQTNVDGYGRGIAKWAKQASLVSAKRRFFSSKDDEVNILSQDLIKARQRCDFEDKQATCFQMYS